MCILVLTQHFLGTVCLKHYATLLLLHSQLDYTRQIIDCSSTVIGVVTYMWHVLRRERADDQPAADRDGRL
jgi:hypothetical protein